MNELGAYQARRLELGDMLRTLLHLVRNHDDQQRERAVRALLTRLASGRFQLAVAGQFSRGKSTLMNALLGDAYLPMGALPMTSVVTTVRYGSRPRGLVRSAAAGLPVEVPVADISRFVARHSAERAGMHVASVDVELPAELLRLGFEFVDTPGIGSAIAANTATTLRYLPSADAVIFVTGFDSPLTEAETGFLTTAASTAGKLFLVINKRDLVPEADAEQVSAFVRQWAHQNLNLADSDVFALSALDALAGAVASDDHLRGASGIGSLRDALTQFLTAERGRLALSNAARAAADLITLQLRDLSLHRQVSASAANPEAVAAAFDERIRELLDQQRCVVQQLTAQAGATVRYQTGDRRARWHDDLRAAIAASANLPPPGDGRAARDLLASGLQSLELAGRARTPEWLDQRAGELQESVVSSTAGDITELLALTRSPRAIGAAAAGLAAGEGDGRGAGWFAEELPLLAVPVISWRIPAGEPGHPARLSRRASETEAARVLGSILDSAVDDFTRRAADAFAGATERWAAALGEQAETMTTAETDQFRRYLRGAPSDGEVEILAGLRQRIESFLTSLAAWDPAPASLPASPDGLAEHRTTTDRGQCSVCARLESVLTAHLIRDQLLLATSEDQQVQHAEARGFCPLHTWQYAQMASPLGIAAGYARLASAIAEALDDIRAGSGSARELGRRAAALADAEGCPVCSALASTEMDAARHIAQQDPLPEAVHLCLRHLARVLLAGPSVAAARAMTAGLAADLRRASQDMRAYALKREALRRGMVSEGEASAAADALRLLAGRPALVQPWPEVINR